MSEPFEPPRLEPRIPEPPPPRRPQKKLPSRGQIQRRRAAGVAGLAGLVVLGVILGSGGGESNPAPVSEEVGKVVKGLSQEEKIDSVLAGGFAGTNPAALDLGKAPGGVVVTAENWPGARAGKALTAALHEGGKSSEVPPLVIGLQEGGDYRAYPDLPPAQREVDIGDTGDPAVAEKAATEMGKALKAAGFDLNLAPVADVATLDSPIADRAFSDDPALVSAMTGAWIRGCRAAGIACAVSHFPGRGAESADTDSGPSTVSIDQAALTERDLPPFQQAVAEKADAVVLSHAFYAAYNAVAPASMTPEIATDLLRDEVGFKGVAITDDLSAGAISGSEDPKNAAVRALAAGADLVLISDPSEAVAARKALLDAIESGDLSQSRLDEAAGRVLELKKKLGLV